MCVIYSEKYCYINRKCKYRFPRKFENEIWIRKNRNIILKYPNNESFVYINKKVLFNNRQAVSWNPFLTKKYYYYINTKKVISRNMS